MPLNVRRLRYWFAVAALVCTSAVGALYFYARAVAGNAKAVMTNLIPLGIQQSTHAFSLSKSEGGHTIYTVRAERATQYQSSGRSELQNVHIVIYGHEHNRFDQIYGDNFSYDPQSGNVVSEGAVHIDLQGEATEGERPDQAPPAAQRNPLRINTSNLVFNQNTGKADTSARVDFEVANGRGSAVGAHYDSKRSELMLDRDVQISIVHPEPIEITGNMGFLSKQPRQAILQQARIVRQATTTDAAQVTMILRPDNTVDRVLGSGGVDSTTVETRADGTTTLHVRSPYAAIHLRGQDNQLEYTDLTGGTKFDVSGRNTAYGSAEMIHLIFGADNQLDKVHAQGNVKIVQPPKNADEAQAGQASAAPPQPPAHMSAPLPLNTKSTGSQNIELDAAAVDLYLAGGNQLLRGETSPNATITLIPQGGRPGEHTLISAAKFDARFKDNHLELLSGSPNAKVVSSAPGQFDRITSSRLIEFMFAPSGGLTQMTQRDNFQYHEQLPSGGERAAWSQWADYNPDQDLLTLHGHPRVTDGGTTTTASLVHIQRDAGNASAEGNVKTTYNDLKPQPDGALLASDQPVHVTARTMAAQRDNGMAHYAGDVRLWQGMNIIAAPAIDFDRDKRTIDARVNSGDQTLAASTAQGPVRDSLPALGKSKTDKVTTILTESDHSGKPSPVNVSSMALHYSDQQRLAQFEGGVVARGAQGTLTAGRMQVFLLPAGNGPGKNAPGGELARDGGARAAPASTGFHGIASSNQVDRIIAEGDVVVQQPGRRATGERLDYQAAPDTYVMTGGAPRLFDAIRGAVTGETLTFYNSDDKVLVEGSDNARATTQTRIRK